MGRKKGSANHGFWYDLSRAAKELLMRLHAEPLDLDVLTKTFERFRRKLDRAIKISSSDDPQAIQRLATGINALSRAVSAIGRARALASRAKEPCFEAYEGDISLPPFNGSN